MLTYCDLKKQNLSNFQTVTIHTRGTYCYKTGLRVHSLFVFGIWSSAVWWIKLGWTKTGSVFFKNDWRNWISRYHFGAVTELFIKTKFYRIRIALHLWNWGCVFMVNIEKITSLERFWKQTDCALKVWINLYVP